MKHAEHTLHSRCSYWIREPEDSRTCESKCTSSHGGRKKAVHIPANKRGLSFARWMKQRLVKVAVPSSVEGSYELRSQKGKPSISHAVGCDALQHACIGTHAMQVILTTVTCGVASIGHVPCPSIPGRVMTRLPSEGARVGRRVICPPGAYKSVSVFGRAAPESLGSFSKSGC